MPDYNHLTHAGIINENYFTVGDRAKNLLDIYNGSAVSNCDLHDLDSRNYFISLFLKSNTDGQTRARPLNLVVALDVSGSMDGALKNSVGAAEHTSRLALAKRAIILLFDKLQPDDAFSLVVFHDQARTVIPSSFKKDLNP